MTIKFPIFDAHFHIIDSHYPLISNQGYLPPEFTVAQYLQKTKRLRLFGGAVVSGSFQGYDQSYLLAALKALGSSFVGVTQLPHTVSDQALFTLNQMGIRAVRFNLKRGGSEDVRNLSSMAKRIYELLDWHTELYIDSSELPNLYNTLLSLPKISIDHLGLSHTGFKTLLKLAEKGVKIKASGFGQVDFDIATALQDIYKANPNALMFGTDLPSTRAPNPFKFKDINLIVQVLGEDAAQRVLYHNAADFYKTSE